MPASSRAVLDNRYELREPLGEGGFATVYRAFDRRFGREVAVKMLRADIMPGDAADRFVREVRLAAQLEHPRIVHLYDAGTHEGVPYYVMSLVPGPTLEARLVAEGALPVTEALAIAQEIGEALAYAHSHQVIHRDVKPANILLGPGGAQLADFGIARAIGEATQSAAVTSAGIAVGTVQYMSPEQLCADPSIDARSDQYSLALVCYEMLTGVRPHGSGSAGTVRAARMAGTTVPPSMHRPEVPTPVDQAVMKALAAEPGSRYADIRQFCDALAVPPSSSQPSALVQSPSRSRMAPIGAGVIVALVLTAVWRWQGGGAPSGTPSIMPVGEHAPLSVVLESSPSSFSTQVEDHLRRIADVRVLTRGDLPDGPVLRLRAESRPLGDSVGLTLGVVGRADTPGASLVLPRDASVPPALLATVVSRVLLGSAADSAPGVEDVVSHHLAAARAYVTAWRAVHAVNLDSATRSFSRAAELAGRLARPSYWEAQVGQWQWPREPERWRPAIGRAMRGSPTLAGVDSILLVALAAYAADSLPVACSHYRAALALDSTLVRSWMGLGDCQRYDSRVVRVGRRWQFRASHWSALLAYREAVGRLGDSAHEQWLAERALGLDYGTVGKVRLGASMSGDQSFAALPTLRDDTLAFDPVPQSALLASARGALPLHYADALATARRLRLQLTTSWVQRSPHSPRAWLNHALVLESLGSLRGADARVGARAALGQVLRGTASDSLNARVAPLLARVLLRMGYVDSAMAIASHASLRDGRDGASMARWMAPLKAFAGQTDAAVRALAIAVADPKQRSDVGDWAVADGLPEFLADTVRRLTLRAALGECAGSGGSVERIEEGFRQSVAPIQRATMRQRILSTPYRLLAPCDGGSAASTLTLIEPLDRAIHAHHIGDDAAARNELARLDSLRMGLPEDAVSIDSRLVESWVRAALGDSTGWRRLHSPAFPAALMQGPGLFVEPVATAVLRRLLIARPSMSAQ